MRICNIWFVTVTQEGALLVNSYFIPDCSEQGLHKAFQISHL